MNSSSDIEMVKGTESPMVPLFQGASIASLIASVAVQLVEAGPTLMGPKPRVPTVLLDTES